MRTVQLRDAKAQLSALVEAAENGEATLVTKHGRPAAMVVPIADARKLYPEKKPSFAELLLSIPHEIPFGRDRAPLRKVEF
jgi:prevent-host-death family protein